MNSSHNSKSMYVQKAVFKFNSMRKHFQSAFKRPVSSDVNLNLFALKLVGLNVKRNFKGEYLKIPVII